MRQRDCFVANVCEPFLTFLHREPDPARRSHMIAEEHALAERAALWGGTDKVCLLPVPLHTAGLLESRFGYRIEARILGVADDRLSRAIRGSRGAIAWLAAIGQTTQLSITSYASTREFADLLDSLRARSVPFSADHTAVQSDGLRVIGRIETKAGFRQVAATLLDGLACNLPEGTTCESAEAALSAARLICRNTSAAVLKANDGEGGFGNVVLSASDLTHIDGAELLRICPFLGLVSVVEAYIPYVTAPSVEFFVPPPPMSPAPTYTCTQFFDRNNYFVGLRLSRTDFSASWYEPLLEFGRRLAGYLQEQGYRGYFDVDALVTTAGELFVLEANLRRTGGTHVHDFAQTVFGDGYGTRVEIVSRSITIPPQSPAEALHRLSPMLIDLETCSGVLPVIVGTAPQGSIELMVFSEDTRGWREACAGAVRALSVGRGGA